MGSHDLGNVSFIFAEALGRPGERRFRLQMAGEEGDAATIWMEKEQLAAVGDAIETVLRDEGYQYQRLPLDDAETRTGVPYAPGVEFRAGELSMGLDRERQRVVLIATSADEADTMRCEVAYRRAHELRRQIADVVAAGRPVCRLCGGPIDPDGHVCVRRNGHHSQN